MRRLLENPFVQWLILIAAVMAGFIAVKYLVNYLPDGGFSGAFKATVQSA